MIYYHYFINENEKFKDFHYLKNIHNNGIFEVQSILDTHDDYFNITLINIDNEQSTIKLTEKQIHNNFYQLLKKK